jgi:hypothetical protein
LVGIVALWSTVIATGGRPREFRAADAGREDDPTVRAPRLIGWHQIRILNVLAMPFLFRSINDLHKALGGASGINVPIRVLE